MSFTDTPPLYSPPPRSGFRFRDLLLNKNVSYTKPDSNATDRSQQQKITPRASSRSTVVVLSRYKLDVQCSLKHRAQTQK